jgi:hypothetical protein
MEAPSVFHWERFKQCAAIQNFRNTSDQPILFACKIGKAKGFMVCFVNS